MSHPKQHSRAQNQKELDGAHNNAASPVPREPGLPTVTDFSREPSSGFLAVHCKRPFTSNLGSFVILMSALPLLISLSRMAVIWRTASLLLDMLSLPSVAAKNEFFLALVFNHYPRNAWKEENIKDVGHGPLIPLGCYKGKNEMPVPKVITR